MVPKYSDSKLSNLSLSDANLYKSTLFIKTNRFISFLNLQLEALAAALFWILL